MGLFHALFLHMSFYQLLSGFFNALFLHMSLCQFFPGFFNALFLHMSLRQLSPRLSGLLFLYMSPKHKETHKKKECSHTETFPLSLCIYFSSFVSFSLLILYSFYLQNNVSVTGDKNFMPAHSSPITNNIIKAPLGVLLSAFC